MAPKRPNEEAKEPGDPKKQASEPTMLCSMCNKSKSADSAFSEQERSKEAPTCKECQYWRGVRLLALPRVCMKCNVLKAREAYSKYEWEVPFPRETLPENYVSRYQTCKDCQTPEAKADDERMDKEAKAMREHNINFYKLADDIEFEDRPSKEELVGIYDIIYHYGRCTDDYAESRTTKGTATLQLQEIESNEQAGEAREHSNSAHCGISGLVQFLKDSRLPTSETYTFQADFKLSTNQAGELRAELLDEEAHELIHQNGEPATSILRTIKTRVACPWIKYEDPNLDLERDELTQFSGLEQAEEIARNHEKAPNHWLTCHVFKKSVPKVVKNILDFLNMKPRPIFFLNPGDLYLYTSWSDDRREPNETICILRKRE